MNKASPRQAANSTQEGSGLSLPTSGTAITHSGLYPWTMEELPLFFFFLLI